jgi:glycosyltransferase involved in cell wall biosynthesis
MIGTSISVLSMNRPEILRQTIEAIKTYAVEPYEIIIVDNGSTDPATISYLNSIESFANIISNKKNAGLSVGTNQGFEASNYDCLIHLDDDCLITQPGWNQIIRSYFNKPNIGMVVPGVYNESIQNDGYKELKWGLGMCYALRRELYDSIGGYDPQLYHQNECDMGLRVRMAGYHVAGISDFHAHHNDPGGLRSPMSIGRERIGCVQFRDKWTSYFKGLNWNYGTDPIYLMQHWPPDEEFMRRWALQNGFNVNPAPELIGTDATAYWDQLDAFSARQIVEISGGRYLIHRTLRNDYTHWEHQNNPGAYERDRESIIKEWFDLTGEMYTKYVWKNNPLKV